MRTASSLRVRTGINCTLMLVSVFSVALLSIPLDAVAAGDAPGSGPGSTTVLPIVGEMDLEDWPLILLAVVVGSVDGFNVCSIGALLVILSLVMVLNSRRLMLLMGGLFILTTVAVYGALMFLWYWLFTYLAPLQSILEFIIVALALGGGIFFLRQFFRFRRYGVTCDSAGNVIISSATSKIQRVFEEGRGVLLLAGAVLVFAGLVVLIEFPCSAAVPVVFVGVLAQAGLSIPALIFHVGLYLFFYMLIEVIVFTVAVVTKKLWLASPGVVTWMNLVGAITLFLLALYFMF